LPITAFFELIFAAGCTAATCFLEATADVIAAIVGIVATAITTRKAALSVDALLARWAAGCTAATCFFEVTADVIAAKIAWPFGTTIDSPTFV
jgi:hypothetical protein